MVEAGCPASTFFIVLSLARAKRVGGTSAGGCWGLQGMSLPLLYTYTILDSRFRPTKNSIRVYVESQTPGTPRQPPAFLFMPPALPDLRPSAQAAPSTPKRQTNGRGQSPNAFARMVGSGLV
jgi:hypothetical protein